MIIRRCLARRPQAGGSLGQACSRIAPTARRNLYTAPTLENDVQLKQNGIPGLFTRKAFKTAYTEYQELIISELNAVTSGTPNENQTIKSLVIAFAREPTKAHEFNLASMAYNNHFFFRGIHTHANTHSQPSSDVLYQITRDFSSLDTLRDTFLATAEAMFGPGFVWLVQTNDTALGSLRILPTYLAGSPLSAAHYRRQSHNLATHNADSFQTLNTVGSFGSAAKPNTAPKKPLGGVDVVPLLCVNTWEHVWLDDFRIGGKRRFLEAWWDKIDWELVRQNGAFKARPSSGMNFQYDL